ncbi:uncharacterized protein LOC126899682 [Daktulosphaira vitifoliae]|uniref:uncharacterized protein LOC126899682 n=1 Tax=Daktulosphaira vitifoliae TaxID=58002 RepID=UPI0021AAC4FD|nr:uncharacterized protein LOC126899682 [Daktulosphaira vitifoliae]
MKVLKNVMLCFLLFSCIMSYSYAKKKNLLSIPYLNIINCLKNQKSIICGDQNCNGPYFFDKKLDGILYEVKAKIVDNHEGDLSHYKEELGSNLINHICSKCDNKEIDKVYGTKDYCRKVVKYCAMRYVRDVVYDITQAPRTKYPIYATFPPGKVEKLDSKKKSLNHDQVKSVFLEYNHD